MKTYARVTNGKVDEIIVADEHPIEDMFHPDLVAELVEVPNGTVVNSIEFNGEWVAPDPEPEGE